MIEQVGVSERSTVQLLRFRWTFAFPPWQFTRRSMCDSLALHLSNGCTSQCSLGPRCATITSLLALIWNTLDWDNGLKIIWSVAKTVCGWLLSNQGRVEQRTLVIDFVTSPSHNEPPSKFLHAGVAHGGHYFTVFLTGQQHLVCLIRTTFQYLLYRAAPTARVSHGYFALLASATDLMDLHYLLRQHIHQLTSNLSLSLRLDQFHASKITTSRTSAMALLPSLPEISSSTIESTMSDFRPLMPKEDRGHRVAAAVLMVEHGSATGTKMSVRKAARYYGISKSTVHRYIQASRGIDTPLRRRGLKKRTRMAPPRKCNINFLLTKDEAPHSNFPQLYNYIQPSALPPLRTQSPLHPVLQWRDKQTSWWVLGTDH